MLNDEIKKIIKTNINNIFNDFDEETRENLINVSIETLENELKNLEKALDENDINKIIDITHSIKGVFLNIQCNDLAEDFNDKKLKELNNEKIIEKTKNNIKKLT